MAEFSGGLSLTDAKYCLEPKFIQNILANHFNKLWENGSFIAGTDGRDRSKIVRQPHVEEVILDHVDDTSGTRAVECRLHVSQPTVWRDLHEERLHPFRKQRVQAFQTCDYPLHVAFCQWFLQQNALQQAFLLLCAIYRLG
ncbi:hypothetical protein TNCV_1303491 [Trichonephila clavipes]|nr:hypothetical protein TNCV_1303491 [Trichonephila clavipes]